MTNIDKLLKKLESQLVIATNERNWGLMCYISGQISVVKIIKECIKEKE